MAARAAVEVSGVEKTFVTGWWPRRRQAALRGVSFAVSPGAVFGILGPNGAGKTTLLSILATLLVPDRGEARVLGLHVVRDAARLRERINMASGSAAFLWSLSPREILDIAGRGHGLARGVRRGRVEGLLDRFELARFAGIPYNELSTGLRQRLALAKAFINEPELVILDEPTVGLDPDVAIRVREQIAELRRARRVTILLSTHYMREAELLCDEVVFLREGLIQARGDAASLKRQFLGGDRIVLRVQGEGWRGLGRLPGVLGVTADGERVECAVDDAHKRLPEVLRHLVAEGVEVSDLRIAEPDLESVFIELAR